MRTSGRAWRGLVTAVAAAFLFHGTLGSTPSHAAGARRPRATRLDFDGDGRADLAMVSPLGKGLRWDVLLSKGGSLLIDFGNRATDSATPGDFDGDGRTDLAVWRTGPTPAFVLRRADGSQRQVPFGRQGDVPVVADFDGDGRDDLAVVRRESTSLTLYVSRGGGGYDSSVFGLPNDEPLVGDYDGDGRADFAVVRRRPSGATEVWFSRPSAPSTVVFGDSDRDYFVPGCDVDGDGRADMVAWRAVRAEAPYMWWVQTRQRVLPPVAFGLGGPGADRPVAADYDGDGRCDIAVYRPSTGVWYVRSSATGAVAITAWPGFLPLARIGTL